MIDKTELLRMIMETNPGQPPNVILEQYSLYLKGINDIHGGNCHNSGALASMTSACPTESQEENIEPATKEAKPSLTCGFTKRKLKVKPADAIKEDKIICCICGKEGQTLTERHLITHNGLTREGYIKLCGYPKDQALMSEKHLNRMKANVMKAQNARRAKKKKQD